ncbi:hypothetical protein [Streptomyces griseus]|uniref:hypothetical protein n=1 Tax=Streptomyces griseus TaxID=1911 RepID=UPI00131E9EFB|nr:hypothetical protein [Streptomyces griseus]
MSTLAPTALQAEQRDFTRETFGDLAWEPALKVRTTLAEANTEALPLTDGRVAEPRAMYELLAQSFLKAVPAPSATAAATAVPQPPVQADLPAQATAPATPVPPDGVAVGDQVEAALRAADEHAGRSVRAAKVRWTIEKGTALAILVDQGPYLARGHTSLDAYADEVLQINRANVHGTIEAAAMLRAVLKADRVSKILAPRTFPKPARSSLSLDSTVARTRRSR